MGSPAHLIVGVSDAKVSAESEDVLMTYSLGSCIGVALHDATAGVGGLLHYQLPASSADPARAAERPLMYADTGMKWLITRMEAIGANRRRMSVRLAGAAQIMDDARIFDIGRRNYTAIRKFLWQQGMIIGGEHVGGATPRTMVLSMSDGSTTIRYNSQIIAL